MSRIKIPFILNGGTPGDPITSIKVLGNPSGQPSGIYLAIKEKATPPNDPPYYYLLNSSAYVIFKVTLSPGPNYYLELMTSMSAPNMEWGMNINPQKTEKQLTLSIQKMTIPYEGNTLTVIGSDDARINKVVAISPSLAANVELGFKLSVSSGKTWFNMATYFPQL